MDRWTICGCAPAKRNEFLRKIAKRDVFCLVMFGVIFSIVVKNPSIALLYLTQKTAPYCGSGRSLRLHETSLL